MKNYEIHPACALFPMMDGDALNELAEDIRAHGLEHPIIMHDGKVLDGRNRLEACKRASVAPRFEDWHGAGDPLEWVVSTNLHRRHLTASQRAMIGAELKALFEGAAKERQREGGRGGKIATPSKSRDEAAKVVNVSARSIEHASKVKASGTQGLGGAVSSGLLPVSTASEAASMPAPVQDRLVEAVTNAATPADARKAARAILKAEKKVHVSHNSGENEWYTPVHLLDAARECMGGIDADPATSEIANRTVGASTWYTAEDDGLSKTWAGRVWMNPPYSQPEIARFSDAVSDKYDAGEIDQACVLVNNATETAWFQRMLSSCSAVCLLRTRVKFLDPSGKPSGAPLQGQAVLYFGADPRAFQVAFGAHGAILVRP